MATESVISQPTELNGTYYPPDSSGSTVEYGEDFEEILFRKPSLFIRSGMAMFSLLLLVTLLFCWFIWYPDMITTEARLTGESGPREIRTRTAGKLYSLLVKEGDIVQQGRLLGVMESRADHKEILALSVFIDSLQISLSKEEFHFLSVKSPASFLRLGETQESYQVFMQSLATYRQYLPDGYFVNMASMLQKDLAYLNQLNTYLEEQRKIQQLQLSLADSALRMNKWLRGEAVIAENEWRDEISKYYGKAMSIPQLQMTIIRNNSSMHEKQKEILQLQNTISQQKNVFSQAVNTLKFKLDDWKNRYLLTAPVKGIVAFTDFLHENQTCQTDQIICFINPEDTVCYARMVIPQHNFGKVVLGQDVLLQFSSFPYQEFGSVKGRIDFISQIPADSGGYLARVLLPHGLYTSRQKKIPYREGLSAKAQIITQDMRLLERIYYSIRGNLQK